MAEKIGKNIYNEEIYIEDKRIIQEAESKNRLVIFVGAGTSISSGMPSWNKAVQSIKECLGRDFQENDSLKIPQYYFNEYGKNNYTSLMHKIFKYGKNLFPKEIHSKILSFKTKYIITTNYDHLLEQAAFNNNQVIHVISTDKDLSYGIAERKLIKMHGDFEHDNFVLKEDDYLNYSIKFRLIETYIKSIIASNVILFIGYSFSDPDLKQIFAWIKDILGNDKPLSYIIDIGEEYSIAKENYFKNFGIKILYASKKIKDYTCEEKEQNLEKMIDFLQDKIRCENSIDELYKSLEPFMNMNYVYKEYIKSIFADQQIIVDFDKITARTSEGYKLLQNIFSIVNYDNKGDSNLKIDEKLYKIIKLLGKSHFRKFTFESSNYESTENTKNVELQSQLDSNVEEICTALIYYDSKALKKLKNENFESLSDNNPIAYFKQAFILYCLHDYIEAYRYLKTATTSCYKNEMYDWYFLSILNREFVSKIIYSRSVDPNEIKKIHQEMDKFDLDKIFLSLPNMGNHYNQCLKDIYTFQIFYKVFQTVYQQACRVKEEATTSYLSYYGIPNFITFKRHIKDIWYYTTSNFLMLNQYQEYNEIFSIYGRNILESTLSPDIKGEKSLGIIKNPSNIRPETLDNFDLYLIIRYLSLKEIKNIVFKKQRKFIPIDTESKNYLSKVASNCKEFDSLKHSELFWKIIYIISHIEFNESLILKIISELINYTNIIDISFNGNIISDFFQSIEEQANIFSNVNGRFSTELCNYLDCILKNTEKIISEIKPSEKKLQNILYTGINLYKKITKIDFSSSEIENILNIKYIDILSIIYHMLSIEYKEKIEHIAKNHQWEIDDDNLYSLYLLAHNKIISIDDELEKRILDYISTLEDDRKNTTNSKYERALLYITNLYTDNLFKTTDIFSNFIKQSGDDFYSFIIDTKNFDYNKFELNWLKYCSSKFLDELRQDEKIVLMIRQKVKEQYIEGHLEDTLMQTYFKHFAT